MDKKFSDEFLINFGKRLSFLLRHDTSYQFDEHGYRDVDELVEKPNYLYINNVKKHDFI